MALPEAQRVQRPTKICKDQEVHATLPDGHSKQINVPTLQNFPKTNLERLLQSCKCHFNSSHGMNITGKREQKELHVDVTGIDREGSEQQKRLELLPIRLVLACSGRVQAFQYILP